MSLAGNDLMNHIPHRYSLLLSAWLCVGCGLIRGALAEDSPAGHDFLQQHCIHCHDGGNTEGGLNLQDLKLNPSDSVKLAKWATVYDRVVAGEMPPEDEGRPDQRALEEFGELTAAALNASWNTRYATLGRVSGRRLRTYPKRGLTLWRRSD